MGGRRGRREARGRRGRGEEKGRVELGVLSKPTLFRFARRVKAGGGGSLPHPLEQRSCAYLYITEKCNNPNVEGGGLAPSSGFSPSCTLSLLHVALLWSQKAVLKPNPAKQKSIPRWRAVDI
jgi:hypothetical protein